jgi:Tfp pilus assembly protein PilV
VKRGRRRSAAGFTLVEAMVATFVAAIMILTLYACFAGGYAMIKMSREDLRATQIVLQQMEAIRVAPYAYLKNATMFPTNTTVYFDEAGKSSGKGGTPYTVTFKAEALPSPKPQLQFYTNMSQVTVTVSWNSGNLQRSRSMQAYAAQRGIQGYVGSAY